MGLFSRGPVRLVWYMAFGVSMDMDAMHDDTFLKRNLVSWFVRRCLVEASGTGAIATPGCLILVG